MLGQQLTDNVGTGPGTGGCLDNNSLIMWEQSQELGFLRQQLAHNHVMMWEQSQRPIRGDLIREVHRQISLNVIELLLILILDCLLT